MSSMTSAKPSLSLAEETIRDQLSVRQYIETHLAELVAFQAMLSDPLRVPPKGVSLYSQIFLEQTSLDQEARLNDCIATLVVSNLDSQPSEPQPTCSSSDGETSKASAFPLDVLSSPPRTRTTLIYSTDADGHVIPGSARVEQTLTRGSRILTLLATLIDRTETMRASYVKLRDGLELGGLSVDQGAWDLMCSRQLSAATDGRSTP